MLVVVAQLVLPIPITVTPLGLLVVILKWIFQLVKPKRVRLFLSLMVEGEVEAEQQTKVVEVVEVVD